MRLNKGFTISSRRSQIFESSPVSNNEPIFEIEEVKEKDSDKQSSELSENNNFVSPEKRKEYKHEIETLNDPPGILVKSKEKGSQKFKKVGFSEAVPNRVGLVDPQSSGSESRRNIDTNIHKFGDVMNEEYFKDIEDGSEFSSVGLTKWKSAKFNKVSLKQEMFEQAYNTHQDEFYREQEKENWTDNKKELYNKLDGLIDVHVEQIIDHIFNESKELRSIFQNDERPNSEKVWKQRFLNYTLKAIRSVKPSKHMMEDTMDINDYIEIELIEYEDDSK